MAIQCMGQDISLKNPKHYDLHSDLTFSAHTINCVCHSIRSMFKVLGIYNFAKRILLSFCEFAHLVTTVTFFLALGKPCDSTAM